MVAMVAMVAAPLEDRGDSRGRGFADVVSLGNMCFLWFNMIHSHYNLYIRYEDSRMMPFQESTSH